VTIVLTIFLVALAKGQAPAKLDLNTVTPSRLKELHGVGRVTAERIVRLRERNGPYRCVEELRAVPRLTEAQYDILSRSVIVKSPDPLCRLQESERKSGRPVQPRK
jgi:competence ComEA-like helix-hairpin-helix protein